MIVFDPPSRTFQEGETLNITCRSISYPEPTYTWWRLGEPLKQTKRIHYDDAGNLVLRKLNRGDEGEYECVGNNVAGSGSGSINLEYIGERRTW